MTWYFWVREVPYKWWAVIVGIALGSMALITITGPKEGFAKSVFTAAGIAPFLCLLTGALLPRDTPLELAALLGGVVALGGTAIIMRLTRMSPVLFGAAFEAVAKTYLLMRAGEVTRLREDGTPMLPNEDLERRVQALDEKEEGDDRAE